MGERKVPTKPGWWWRDPGEPVLVFKQPLSDDLGWSWHGGEEHDVTDDGLWIREIRPNDVPAAEVEALRAAWSARESDLLAMLEQERDARVTEAGVTRRYREAVGRLRGVLESCRSALVRGDEDHDGLACDVVSTLAATTDEAIQGYDEPPPGDAALLAKANAALVAELEDRPTWADVVDTAEATSEAADRRLAALVAEVAELRAELAAERGEADGAVSDLWTPSFDYEGVVLWSLRTRFGDYVLRGPRRWYATTYDMSDLPDGVEQAIDDALGIMAEQPYARSAMRAVEAEARRLGLLADDGEQPKPGGGA